MQLQTISDTFRAAERLAADLVWRRIEQHPYQQIERPSVAPCESGLCERAPQTLREATASFYRV